MVTLISNCSFRLRWPKHLSSCDFTLNECDPTIFVSTVRLHSYVTAILQKVKNALVINCDITTV